MEFDNPAQRLLDILVEGKELNPKLNCRAAWKTLLKAESESEAALLARLGKVMELPEQTMNLLGSVGENDDDAHQHWVQQVSTAFSKQDFGGYWETFSNHIDMHCLSYLKISARLLKAHSTVAELPESTLETVRSEVQSLIEMVLASNLPSNLKQYLVRSFQRVLVAVQEYSITGAVPVIEALEVTFGHSVADLAFREAVKESDVGDQIWEVLFKISATVSLATGLPALAAGAVQLLLS